MDASWVEPFLAAGCPGAERLNGHYHENRLVEREGRRVVLRIPLADVPVMDLKRLREHDVLAHLERHDFPAPRVLAEAPTGPGRRWALHSFVPGTPLHALHPRSAPLPDRVADACGGLLRALHALDPAPLAPQCADVAQPPDARGLFRALLRFAVDLHARHRPRFGRAFDRLGIPPQPFAVVAPTGEALPDAPFALCHLDAHRRNLHVLDDGRLVLLDWELALVADPAYELAVHLHRMRYSTRQETRLLDAYLGHAATDTRRAWLARIAPYRHLEEARAAVGDLVRTAAHVTAARDEDERRAVAEHYAGKLRRAWALWHDATERAPPDADDVLAALRRA